MMIRNILTVLFFGFSSALFAQTVIWQMPLSDYSEIVCINQNLYKVTQNGKIGLINTNGNIVAPTMIDNISGFYEHKALATYSDGNGERVAGCLTDDGNYYAFARKYYTLSGQKFFSDGLLSVSNEQGKLGYVDHTGNAVLGFDGKYDKIKPFVEGFAAVFKNKKYYLIDKDGTSVKFTFKRIGEVNGGTNVYNGRVYVWEDENHFYTYDVNKGGACEPTKKPSSNSLDYLYRFSSISGQSKEIPFKGLNMKTTGKKGLSPISEGGQYGYKSGETVVLPCQLSAATSFEDGLAIVSLNGQKGILQYIDGANFQIAAPTSSFNFYAGDEKTCQFNVSVPSIWREKSMEVITKDSKGTTISTVNTGDSYTFKVRPSSTGKQDYSVTIYAERLKLFEGNLTYLFTKKEVQQTPKEIIVVKKDDKGEKEPICPTCHKQIRECEYGGVH